MNGKKKITYYQGNTKSLEKIMKYFCFSMRKHVMIFLATQYKSKLQWDIPVRTTVSEIAITLYLWEQLLTKTVGVAEGVDKGILTHC